MKQKRILYAAECYFRALDTDGSLDLSNKEAHAFSSWAHRHFGESFRENHNLHHTRDEFISWFAEMAESLDDDQSEFDERGWDDVEENAFNFQKRLSSRAMIQVEGSVSTMESPRKMKLISEEDIDKVKFDCKNSNGLFLA